MYETAKQFLEVLRRNKANHPRHWAKVRVDRVNKLVPQDVDVTALLEYLEDNNWIKRCYKLYGNQLVPAIRLRYKTALDKCM